MTPKLRGKIGKPARLIKAAEINPATAAQSSATHRGGPLLNKEKLILMAINSPSMRNARNWWLNRPSARLKSTKLNPPIHP